MTVKANAKKEQLEKVRVGLEIRIIREQVLCFTIHVQRKLIINFVIQPESVMSIIN